MSQNEFYYMYESGTANAPDFALYFPYELPSFYQSTNTNILKPVEPIKTEARPSSVLGDDEPIMPKKPVPTNELAMTIRNISR
jgi:hypothetical protein